MIPTASDFNDVDNSNFSFNGNWRAIVENNEDQTQSGRVRVRILGIHSLDPEITPVDQLPWAQQCLALYNSGGKNLDSKEEKSLNRYSPDGSTFTPPSRNSTELVEEFKDEILSKEGTGGFFTIPRKGSLVWIFFENGDHTQPRYWAAAPKAEDWIRQKEKLVDDIKTKNDNIEYWRKEYKKALDKKVYEGSDTTTQNAKVGLINDIPKLDILSIDDIENYHITSYTSPGGVTHIIINKKGNERHYLIHKGYIEYTEETGQKKVMVGNTNFKNDSQVGTANDYEILIGNNQEIHIGGDSKVHIRKSKSVQIDGDCNINVNNNVGLISKNGNVNILVSNGDCNIDTFGKTNIHAANDIQIHSDKDIKVKSDGSMIYHSIGKMSFISDDEISFKSNKSTSIISNDDILMESINKFDITSGKTTSFKCTKFSVSCVDSGFHVDGGSKFKIDTYGFGGDKTGNAHTFNGRHPGCFPGPIAGFSTPYPGAPLAPTTPPAPVVLKFNPGASTVLQKMNPAASTPQSSVTSLSPISTPKSSLIIG